MVPYHSDSVEARCNGLKSGYAVSEKTGKRVYCAYVTKKDGPFYCPKCNSIAIVRKCSEKEDHFAHKPRLSPILTVKDQTLHTDCKNSICNYLSKQFPKGNWAIERPIPASERLETKMIIPDISGRINNIPVAIEVQKTAYTLNKIREKTEIYNKRGVCVLWIIPLREELGDDDFRPRLFEKYLHAMYLVVPITGFQQNQLGCYPSISVILADILNRHLFMMKMVRKRVLAVIILLIRLLKNQIVMAILILPQN